MASIHRNIFWYTKPAGGNQQNNVTKALINFFEPVQDENTGYLKRICLKEEV